MATLAYDALVIGSGRVVGTELVADAALCDSYNGRIYADGRLVAQANGNFTVMPARATMTQEPKPLAQA